MELAANISQDTGFIDEIGPVGRSPIVLLVGDLDVRYLLPSVLGEREVVVAHTVDEAVEIAGRVGADALVCSLLLCHLESRAACVATIAQLASRYKLILFVEPSSHESDYLARHHVKSFHGGIRVNRSMDILSIDLFLDHSSFAEVEHFGWNVAQDDSATWLVPLDAPPDTFPPGTSWRPRVVFDRLVFEFSCFACRSYNAPVLDIARDLLPISLNRKRSAFRLSGAGSGNFAAVETIGRDIYRSPSSPVSMPHQSVPDRDGLAPSGLSDSEVEQKWVQNRQAFPFDLRMSLLNNCIVTGHGAVLSDGILAEESRYMLGLLVGQHAVRDGMSRRHAIGHVEGLSVVALNVASGNYYHWLAQVMPALLLARDACDRNGIDALTVILREPEEFATEYVRLIFAGFRKIEIVALRQFEYVTTSRSLYSNSLGEGPIDRVMSEHALLVSKLKQHVDVSQRPATRDIYISRVDTSARPMTNEAALIDNLWRRGLEIVTLTGMSVAEQIAVFHDARLIVGAHGAGLANVVFARPGATLLELSQTDYSIPCFLRLAQAVGVRHVMQFFDRKDAEADSRQAWLVDVDAVGAAIDGIVASAPAYDFTIMAH